MFEIARDDRIALALAGLPGLLQFGLEPLRLHPMRRAFKVRVYLPGNGTLNLEGISVSSPHDVRSAVAAARMSSRHASSRPPEDLLSGGAVHTDEELSPHWEVEFRTPVQIDELSVSNRVGLWSGRALGLCIDLLDENGTTWTYDNLGVGRIHGQLVTFQSRCGAFVAHCHGLSESSRETCSKALLAFSETAARLISAIRHALEHGTGNLDELVETRLFLVASLARIHEGLAGKELIGVLKLSYPLFDWLLPRSKAVPVPDEPEVELTAAALMFVSVMTESRHVRLPHVRDHERLLATPTYILFVEEAVNRFYSATGLTRTTPPIMFRAHGMSGSAPLSDPQSFVRSMKEVESILDAIGYRAAVCYGTFLGAVREKGFIPHDDDVDMAVQLKGHVPLEQELGEIIAALAERGVDGGKASGHLFLKIRPPVHKRLVDVFPIEPKSDDVVRMYMQELKLRDVPRHVVLPFGTVELYGETFHAPASADGFLTERYGPTWRTPQRIVGTKTVAA